MDHGAFYLESAMKIIASALTRHAADLAQAQRELAQLTALCNEQDEIVRAGVMEAETLKADLAQAQAERDEARAANRDFNSMVQTILEQDKRIQAAESALAQAQAETARLREALKAAQSVLNYTPDGPHPDAVRAQSTPP